MTNMMPVISTTKLLQINTKTKKDKGKNRLNNTLNKIQVKRKALPAHPIHETSCECTIMHVTKIVINCSPKKRKRGGSNIILSMTSWGGSGSQKRIKLPSVKLAKKFAKKEMMYDSAEFIKNLENQLKALNIGKGHKNKKEASVPATQRSKPDREADAPEANENADDGGDVKRRGKRRRKGRGGGSDRLTSAGLAALTQQDPETQVAGIYTDSRVHSSRSSIAPATDDVVLPVIRAVASRKTVSFLDDDILKYLHREVDEEAIETEFDTKRRYVLEEALRTRPARAYGKEMQVLLRELRVPAVSLGDWLHVPRVFSRQSSQFTLPLDSNTLEDLSPMQYAARHVTIAKSKQLLYLTVLRKFTPEGYRLPIADIPQGLVLMMGGILTDENVKEFQITMEWDEYEEEHCNPDDIKLALLDTEYGRQGATGSGDASEDKSTIKYKTWCGVCAICERMYGRFPARDRDPPDGMELSDFTMIETKLSMLNVHPGLSKILHTIRTR